jgi:hypothetical protein
MASDGGQVLPTGKASLRGLVIDDMAYFFPKQFFELGEGRAFSLAGLLWSARGAAAG